MLVIKIVLAVMIVFNFIKEIPDFEEHPDRLYFCAIMFLVFIVIVVERAFF